MATGVGTDAALGTQTGTTLGADSAIGLGLGMGFGSLLGTPKTPPLPYGQQVTHALQQQGQLAGFEQQTGQQFIDPVFSGKLPPGMQAMVDQSLNDAMGNIKSQYAQLGLGNSSMLADAESYAMLQSGALRGELAMKLAGIGENMWKDATAGFGSNAQGWGKLMETQLAQDKQAQDSLSKFMGALGMAGGAVIGGMLGGPAGAGIGASLGKGLTSLFSSTQPMSSAEGDPGML
jgi:hypothetical protein